MASTATATATMCAAAGFDKRASTASSFLTTPGSGCFPSELCSPSIGSPGFLKRENDLRTPITPPSAYLDFLKNMSPAMLSPAPNSACARISFQDRPFERDSGDIHDDRKSSVVVSTSQPSLSRNTSYDSNASNSTSTTNSSADQSVASSTAKSSAVRTRARPESPRVIIPPSPFAKPGPRSARTPRRLHIPQSPFSPAMQASQSVTSPYSANPRSATPWSATYNTREGDNDGSGKPGKVCVRQVITRTVTYCRTPLEPAPKGKRRKIEIVPPTPIAEVVAVKLEEPFESKLFNVENAADSESEAGTASDASVSTTSIAS